MIFNFLKNLLLLVYPNKCVFCGKVIEINNVELICNSCVNNIPVFSKNFFVDSRNGNKGFCAVKYNDIIKSSIHRFKYKNNISYAKYYADIMFKCIKNNPIFYADYLVPVPIYKGKRRKRGFNQSELIAIELSKYTKIPYNDMLERTRNTKSQSKVKFSERQENVKDAFVLKKGFDVKGKDIIIIDDIYTSGNTIRYCRKALEENGANVLFFTFATVKNLDEKNSNM